MSKNECKTQDAYSILINATKCSSKSNHKSPFLNSRDCDEVSFIRFGLQGYGFLL